MHAHTAELHQPGTLSEDGAANLEGLCPCRCARIRSLLDGITCDALAHRLWFLEDSEAPAPARPGRLGLRSRTLLSGLLTLSLEHPDL